MAALERMHCNFAALSCMYTADLFHNEAFMIDYHHKIPRFFALRQNKILLDSKCYVVWQPILALALSYVKLDQLRNLGKMWQH